MQHPTSNKKNDIKIDVLFKMKINRQKQIPLLCEVPLYVRRNGYDDFLDQQNATIVLCSIGILFHCQRSDLN